MFENLYEILSAPWPWWAGGLVIGLTVFLLEWFGKEFGLSANLRTLCAIDGADELNDFFKFDWTKQLWNLVLAAGAMFGGYIASHYFGGDNLAHISAETVDALNQIAGKELLQYGHVPIVPTKEFFEVPDYWDLYSWKSLFTLKGFIVIAVGGFLVGFGARYAGGCTSGHAISGIAALQLPSLIAVISFFIGGLIATYLLLPWVLNL